ncbi:patatin-like phospholipase family protein [Pontiella sulfatireligans]|uniref:PNPLA domain-containing protein n=1 Tax=Pontiella sulfatireligans TaxID=2750658 RepID=A0A6C2UT09_9BACT|nr:patatin-like phospholipase family protein [Pontiella sulfatireligans]VGO23455.1 hypothetical protein SCARR_05562 [Pontiella sulfatireligans]
MNIVFLQQLKGLGAGALLLVLAGCASYGVIDNTQQVIDHPDPDNYDLNFKDESEDDNAVWLALSGGGTRAAALAYGVLQELNETQLNDKDATTALEAVDTISSVSGGSFTAAYYGLYGNQIFENFEDEFLRVNIEGRLIRRMYLNPLQWFRRTGRNEQAVKYYDKNIFHGATFADLKKKNGPLLLINATDLDNGVRFTFIQEYFDLLSSDIATFPVSRAVTASSAVPVLFDPIVAMNYGKAKEENNKPSWLQGIQSSMQKGGSPQLQMLTGGINSYFDQDNRQFVHFVDGGITDNLGLRAIHDIFELGGGIKNTYAQMRVKPPRRLILISVNASKKKMPSMGGSNKQPSLAQTLGSVSSIQMSRYTKATEELMKERMVQWGEELSTPDRPVSVHMIHVRFDDVVDEEEREFLNTIPTSFSLTDEQVDALIKAGRELLRNQPEFKKLIQEFN